MKTMKTIVAVIILAVTFASCDKNMTLPERMDLAKGDLLYRWGMVYYINSNHDTVFAKNNPCIADDVILFQANNTGYVDQGSCIAYPGKAKNVPFRFEQLGINRFKLITTAAGVQPDGQTWFSEGYNIANLSGEELPGEGKRLHIVETYPVYQEWVYTVLSD